MIATVLIILVAALHFWFMALEMFLWQSPRGLKTFGNTVEKARATAVLAANQGLYNGFLAAGLLVSLWRGSFDFQIYFLSCVVVAGVYGAWSVSRKIFFIQALPALLGLAAVVFRA